MEETPLFLNILRENGFLSILRLYKIKVIPLFFLHKLSFVISTFETCTLPICPFPYHCTMTAPKQSAIVVIPPPFLFHVFEENTTLRNISKFKEKSYILSFASFLWATLGPFSGKCCAIIGPLPYHCKR